MAKTATQVLQLVMEAIAKAPASQHRHDLLRKLRMCQDMASNFSLDVPITGDFSNEAKEILKNSVRGGSAKTVTATKDKEDGTVS